MAKRTRGSRRDRRRTARQAPFAPPVARPTTEALTATDEALAAPGMPVSAAPIVSDRTQATTRAGRASVLTARAAEEYRYVTLDLRRIVVVVGSLFAGMLALWVALDVLKVATI